MRRRAFTLVELVVVIGVLALLAAVLTPSMCAVTCIARRTICQNHLSQIGTALQTHVAQQRQLTHQAISDFPDRDTWPEIPQNVVPQGEVYQCPDDTKPFVQEDENLYQLYTVADRKLIPFRAVPDYCLVIDRGGYLEHRFDAGTGGGRGIIDNDDVVFRVSKTRPKVATFWPDNPNRPFQGIDTMSLLRKGKVVPGWQDFRNVRHGAQIVMKAPRQSSYGINAFSEDLRLLTPKVVLLDYPETVVEFDAQTDQKIGEAARHLGRLNVLYADNCVRAKLPQELSTVRRSGLWWP